MEKINGELTEKETSTEAIQEGNENIEAESLPEELPKKRGRRKKNPAEGITGEPIPADELPKKRGRKSKRLEFDPEKTGKKLQFIHKLIFQHPAFALKDDEATQLADALADVANEFGVSINPKFAAIANLALVCGSIYGPRIIMYKMMLDADKKKKADLKAMHDQGLTDTNGIPTNP